jgi:ribosome recycling factor
MTEEIEFILDSTEESMIGSIAHLGKNLNIRAGKEHLPMLGSVFVDYYGSATPLRSGQTSVPDARTITLQPFERNASPHRKAIMVANIGFNPMNNLIIISVPPLTEERRRDLGKQAKVEAEDAKVGSEIP